MKKIKRNSQIDKILKYLLITLTIFVLFVTLGSYLNKLYPQAQNSIIDNIKPTVEYYDSNIKIKDVLVSNIKTGFILMGSIYILSLLAITFPIAIITVVLKAISIGYTINIAILALKLDSIKFVMITMFKNMAIVPGVLILFMVSIKYILDIINIMKMRNNKNRIKSYIKQYSINSAIIIIITITTQTLINAISIATLQKLL